MSLCSSFNRWSPERCPPDLTAATTHASASRVANQPGLSRTSSFCRRSWSSLRREMPASARARALDTPNGVEGTAMSPMVVPRGLSCQRGGCTVVKAMAPELLCRTVCGRGCVGGCGCGVWARAWGVCSRGCGRVAQVGRCRACTVRPGCARFRSDVHGSVDIGVIWAEMCTVRRNRVHAAESRGRRDGLAGWLGWLAWLGG